LPDSKRSTFGRIQVVATTKLFRAAANKNPVVKPVIDHLSIDTSLTFVKHIRDISPDYVVKGGILNAIIQNCGDCINNAWNFRHACHCTKRSRQDNLSHASERHPGIGDDE
jgi:hypothetical protein